MNKHSSIINHYIEFYHEKIYVLPFRVCLHHRIRIISNGTEPSHYLR